MTKKQQYQLDAYFNLIESSTWLFTGPILGLLPKFTEEDYVKFCKGKPSVAAYKSLILILVNVLFEIDLDDNAKNTLYKYFPNDDDFLTSINIAKENFRRSILI